MVEAVMASTSPPSFLTVRLLDEGSKPLNWFMNFSSVNIAISAIAPVVPDKVHIPVYIVVIATFVTILQFAMQAYTPAMYATLGLFIPLIVVNCIVLGRAEAFANKNGILDSALDGLGIGLGFTLSLTVLGIVREILGSGSIFGLKFISGDGMLAFVMAPGAFLALGYLMVLFNKIAKKN